MARDPQDSWNDLVARGMDLGAGMLRLYGETLRAMTTRTVSYPDLAQHAVDLARREGGAYARAMTRAGFDYWERVLETGAELKERAAGFAGAGAGERGGAARAAAAGEAGASGMARLDFAGRPGDEVTRAFVVENNQAETVTVSFEVSAFVPERGGDGLKLPLAVDPESFDLAPGQERVVSCRLTLSQDLAADERYAATLRVIGFPDLQIALTATALP